MKKITTLLIGSCCLISLNSYAESPKNKESRQKQSTTRQLIQFDKSTMCVYDGNLYSVGSVIVVGKHTYSCEHANPTSPNMLDPNAPPRWSPEND